LQSHKKNKAMAMQTQTEPAFLVELTIGGNTSFYDILLEAIDASFLSLGEPVRTSIYRYLENSGIKKSEIPFRIEDFQKTLEKLFEVGARHLELLVIMNLHDKIKIKYKWDMHSCVVPDITFQEYIRLVKRAYENSNKKTNE
jgi:hypothetical protein